jgi:hypothetical protein
MRIQVRILCHDGTTGFGGDGGGHWERGSRSKSRSKAKGPFKLSSRHQQLRLRPRSFVLLPIRFVPNTIGECAEGRLEVRRELAPDEEMEMRERQRAGMGGAEGILFGSASGDELECEAELACSLLLTGVGARPEDLM